MRNAYKISVGNPEGKKQLGRARRIWWESFDVVSSECVFEDPPPPGHDSL
jgi:hypothetical protein